MITDWTTLVTALVDTMVLVGLLAMVYFVMR
jgi:hypothetical protein